MSGGVPAWAVPGAKVSCVSTPERWRSRKHGGSRPVEGVTYTVREAFVSQRGTVGVRLLEIKCTRSRKTGIERGWKLSRFRPLVTRSQEQDMAVFRPILDQVRPSIDQVTEAA